ncbi:ATP-dependent nuclease [Candidatus Xianfuyuplasma coldseepsis]|uniref:ATP-binding protein n=1 Tax=Candidatus Xianfuyuplasma coldseepsis TaxID=2782163 RepID=A0A7L7KPK9_9MOLU|nr:ATP-binding protein [Xianfuyuplasma coldseepsis]QMS84495.1 ATP-binding protein [Xianfuyuplasma coldseepsis]
MIEHIYIKNYKAFKRENIVVDKHTLLIGPYDSGKTTVLEALDLFFNNHLRHDFIRNTKEDIVIELLINDTRYRKVYAPPDYYIDYQKCIGNMYDINHIRYLHIGKTINNQKLLNDILTINLTTKLDPTMQARIFKVSDYIDGTLGNSNYKIFQTTSDYQMYFDEDISFTTEEYQRILSNITYQYLVIGIDNVEQHFDTESLKKINQYTYQTIYTTNDSAIVKTNDYYVSTLYKGNKNDDFDTVKKRLSSKQNKTYLLVEGKYDVNWYETAIRLLDKQESYTVIPCGGVGNITFVKEQLEKEGYKTLVITDGDSNHYHPLEREIVELYGDLDFINRTFHTDFTHIPKSKHTFFKALTVKDDVAKNILSHWAKKHLTADHPFVQEIAQYL